MYLVDLGIQMIMCAHAVAFRTEKFYDLTGSSTYVILTIISLAAGKWRTAHDFTIGKFLILFPSILLVLWAVRLGAFLFRRVMRQGHDSRFENAKKQPALFFVFWFIQSLWIIFVSHPVYYVNFYAKEINARGDELSHSFVEDDGRLAMYLIGMIVGVGGFLLEIVADEQKSKFKDNPDNKGKFISSGVWSFVRYPNYLGEITIWLGQYLMCAAIIWNVLGGVLFLLSPVFITLLLTGLSGIPIQEKQANERWKDDPMFQLYKQRTKKLIPFIW